MRLYSRIRERTVIMAKKEPIQKKPIANKGYKSDKQLARLAEKKKNEKNAFVKKVVVRGVAAVVAVALVVTAAVVGYNAVLDGGNLLRSRSAMETDNFNVTSAMMSYYVYDGFYDYVEELGGDSAAKAKGLDVNKSLKKQAQSSTGVYTWFDYFLDEAKAETEDMLIKLEAAKQDGVELTAEELADVKAKASVLDVNKYGRGLLMADIEKAMEYRALADKYTEKVEGAITVTEEELEEYYEKHKEDYQRADYLKYVIHYDLKKDNASTSSATSSNSGKDEIVYGRDYDEAKKLADELKACESKTAFLDKIVELFEEEKEGLEEELLITGLKPSEGVKLNDWVFDEETKVGDTMSEQSSSAGTFTVYMLDKAAYRSEIPVATIRRILLNKKVVSSEKDEDGEETNQVYETDEEYEKRVKDLLDSYLAGDKTAENFGKLADENSADKKNKGGLYENIEAENLGDAIADWVYEEGRKQGDTGMVMEAGAWNILYFDSVGEAAWKFEANEDVYEQKVADAWTEIEKRDITVIAHHNYMDSIPAAK